MFVKMSFCVLAYNTIIGTAEITAAEKKMGLELEIYIDSVLNIYKPYAKLGVLLK